MEKLENTCSKCTLWKVVFLLSISGTYLAYINMGSLFQNVLVFENATAHDVNYQPHITAGPSEKREPSMNPVHDMKSHTLSRERTGRLIQNVMKRRLGEITISNATETQEPNSSLTDTVAYCTDRKFLVYTCTAHCGGLGDRQKGIISSFLLALLTNRTFVIKMESPCGIETFLKPNRYEWMKCKSYLSQIDKGEVNHVHSMDGSETFSGILSTTDFKVFWPQRLIYLHTNQILIDHVRNHTRAKEMLNWITKMTNDDVINYVLLLLFQPRDRLVNQLRNFVTERVKNKTFVCSHIRYGRNPSIPRDSHLLLGTPNVTTVFSFLKKYDDVVKYVVYIATDALAVRERAKQSFSNVVTLNRMIVHVDKVDLNTGSKESCEGFYTAILEQLLLSKCDVLVLTRSNFGAMAAYMRGHSDNLFIYHKITNNIISVSTDDIQKLYQFL